MQIIQALIADGIAIYGHDGISLYTAQTERLRVASNGLVGIGTDAPGQKLDIDGNIRLRAGNTTTYATTLKSNLNATHTSSLHQM